jgi:hypothetical protein
MRISDRGVLNCGEPDTERAVSTFPAVALLADGTLLATYRVGTTKDSADGTIELRRSDDGGRSWSDGASPFGSTVNGTRGSLQVAYVTPVADDHLIAAALWVDREAYPGMPLFNEKTEGCLPMAILLSDSQDLGRTWTPWRVLPLPEDVGPPSLTSPILRLPSGRLAVSIETNKCYLDTSPWLQRVVYAYSEDSGQTWGSPVTVCQDPTARIFHWDQRAGVCPNGQLMTFTWTYDRETNGYLNVQRRLSKDEGSTWSAPDDLGFADQPSHPAILPDGRVVIAWVDRFRSRSIRARLSGGVDGPFLPESEVILYELEATVPAASAGAGTTGDSLAEMGVWNYGLPFAEALPDGDVMVVYYEGTGSAMDVCCVRLSL